MTKIIIPFLFLSLFVTSAFAQGTLVEDTIILHLDFDDIDVLLQENGLPLGLLPTDYEVDVHRVVYTTPDVDGSPTTASGLICLPSQDSCALPMMAYLHGTKVKKDDTFYYLNGEWSLGVITATSGYAMCLPDYLGLGNSPGIHPYQHAQSEATASIDILRACRIICDEQGIPLNDQLFLVGYSQGGHSVMATHRMIQEELSNEFTVTASAPGSGPYDMSGEQLDMVASFDPYAQPGYLPYLIQSYQHVYGNLYDSIQQIYIPPYDVTLPPLLDGNYTMGQLNAAMPSVPRLIFQQEYQDAFFSDTLHPAFLALKDNNVYNWVPEAPVMFNYCRSDEEVTYLNTVVASEYMINAGALDIQVIERDTALGHFECAQPSILFSKLWFDVMANFCGEDNTSIDNSNEFVSIGVYPNPVTNGLIQFDNQEPMDVRVLDLRGKQLISNANIKPGGSLNLKGLKPAIVLLQMQFEEKVVTQRLVIQ